MQVSSKRLNSANAAISATVDAASIAKAEDRIAQSLAREAKMDGFRKGKVPTALIKQRFKDRMAADVRSELAQQALEAGLKELGNPELLGMPSITRFDEKANSFELELKLSTRPNVDLGDYMAIVPEHKPVAIPAKEVEEAMQKAADSTAIAEEVKTKRALKNKDVAVFDFAGFLDDKPLERGSGNDHELEIGSNSFIPGFEEQMVGMKPGENRTLNLTFPEDYHAGEIAGKAVRFEVTLKSIKVKNPVVLDDATAAKLLPGVEGANLEKLREVVEQSMAGEKKSELYQNELKPKLLESLTKKYKFDLPETIVDQEIDHLATQKAREMDEEALQKLSGNEDEIKKLRESVRAEAEDRVKTTLIIDALAKAEAVSVSDQEVMQVIYYEGMRSGMNPKELLEYYKQNNLLPVVKMSLTEDRVLNTLLSKKNDAETAEKPAKKPAAKKAAAEQEGEEKPAKKPAAKKAAKSAE
ncbi:MAG: trigger factor [Campylobacterales bacterium]